MVALPALFLELDRFDRDRPGVGVQVRGGLMLGDPAANRPLVGEDLLAGSLKNRADPIAA